MSGHDQPFKRAERKHRAASSLMIAFPPDRDQTHAQTQQKQRNELHEPPPNDPFLLQPRNQKRVRDVQKNVDPMISGWIQIPERALDPKGCVSEWKILRWRIEREPNPFQTVRCGEQMIFCDVIVVVPDEPAVPRGPVDKD